jgi:hypothetical protein
MVTLRWCSDATATAQADQAHTDAIAQAAASSTPQLERAWDAWQAERYQRGEISQRPDYADNPFRPR